MPLYGPQWHMGKHAHCLLCLGLAWVHITYDTRTQACTHTLTCTHTCTHTHTHTHQWLQLLDRVERRIAAMEGERRLLRRSAPHSKPDELALEGACVRAYLHMCMHVCP